MIRYFFRLPFEYKQKTIRDEDLEEIEGIELDNGDIKKRFILKGEENGDIFMEAKGIIEGLPYNYLKFPHWGHY